MNKEELTKAMVAKTNMHKKDCEDALQAFQDIVMEELAKGEKVSLFGFGTFEVADRAARIGRNPHDGTEIQIPASKSPKFKPGKLLKDAVKA